jgi:hypothetical protein
MRLRGAAASLAAGLFLLGLLSGCASKASGSGDLQLADGKTVDLAAAAQGQESADRGVISGVVVDPAIRPIAGANLTVVGQGLAARADASGIFVVPNLKPGLYTVAARAAGFLPVQTTAEVKAGETTKVRIAMDVDRTPVPFHSPTVKFKGFYNVGSGLFDEVGTLDVWNRSVGPARTPESATCTCVFGFDMDGNFTTIVVEAAWTPSPAKPDLPDPANLGPTEMTWAFKPDAGKEPPLTFCYGSPCASHMWGGNVSADARHVTLHFWSDASWVTVNQDFEAFVTIFYNGAAPPDWAFTKGST